MFNRIQKTVNTRLILKLTLPAKMKLMQFSPQAVMLGMSFLL